MRFYERLYVGDEAKKRRYSIIQAVREGKKTGYWILTLPSNEKNLLDLYPAMAPVSYTHLDVYKRQDFFILILNAFAEHSKLLSKAHRTFWSMCTVANI